MNIKRFTGPDMRSAIKKVRDMLGPDAVILSNHTTSEGVEVVAAIDYDESLLQDSPLVSAPTKQSKHVNKQQAEKEINRNAIWDDVRYGRDIPQSPNAVKYEDVSKTKQALNTINEKPMTFKLAEDKSFQQVRYYSSDISAKYIINFYGESTLFLGLYKVSKPFSAKVSSLKVLIRLI